MEAWRYLRCLGQPALFSPAGDPIRFRTKKHLALLVYLAVDGRQTHRRDRLAEMFWPNVSGAEARHSLATALSILRPRLGLDGIEATRDHVTVARSRLELDLDRLVSGRILGTELEGPLEIAGFLDGFEIPDSKEFALWKDREQARLLPRIMSAFSLLVDNCRRHGDTRQIEHLAGQMLLLDDLCEDAIRAKMESLAFAGDRLSALRTYEEWRTQLAQELHATPSAQLENMAPVCVHVAGSEPRSPRYLHRRSISDEGGGLSVEPWSTASCMKHGRTYGSVMLGVSWSSAILEPARPQ